jgi:hypothetical protein
MYTKLCEGAQDERGPVCEGPHPTWYVASGPESYGELMVAHWCDDCVALAIAEQGWTIHAEIRGDKLHVKPGDRVVVNSNLEW